MAKASVHEKFEIRESVREIGGKTSETASQSFVGVQQSFVGLQQKTRSSTFDQKVAMHVNAVTWWVS